MLRVTNGSEDLGCDVVRLVKVAPFVRRGSPPWRRPLCRGRRHSESSLAHPEAEGPGPSWGRVQVAAGHVLRSSESELGLQIQVGSPGNPRELSPWMRRQEENAMQDKNEA